MVEMRAVHLEWQMAGQLELELVGLLAEKKGVKTVGWMVVQKEMRLVEKMAAKMA